MTKFVGHCHGGKVKFEIETTLDYSARCTFLVSPAGRRYALCAGGEFHPNRG